MLSKFVYKVLNFFDCCDHDYKSCGLEMVTAKGKLITMETFKCSKCEKEFRKYYIQDAE